MDLATFQARARAAFTGIEHPRVGAALALGEECGEVLRCVLETEVYGRDMRPQLSAELGDVLLALTEVAARYEIDLAHVASAALQKIEAAAPGWRADLGAHLSARRLRLDG